MNCWKFWFWVQRESFTLLAEWKEILEALQGNYEWDLWTLVLTHVLTLKLSTKSFVFPVIHLLLCSSRYCIALVILFFCVYQLRMYLRLNCRIGSSVINPHLSSCSVLRSRWFEWLAAVRLTTRLFLLEDTGSLLPESSSHFWFRLSTAFVIWRYYTV